MYYLGVDLGGTNIKVALVDENAQILAEDSRPTNLPRTAQAVCDDIAALCRGLQEHSGGKAVAGIGVGCPGTVDDATGQVLYSNNLGWQNFAMGPYLAEKTGLPVRLANDANAAALGEALAGCAKNAESAVILTLGTGVGGGVVLGGKLLTGYTGAAAEPGHMVIRDGGALCTCGRQGCLEAYASATALIRATRAAMAAHPESAMHALAATGGVTGRTAFDGAAAGDAAATAVVTAYTHDLALGVANLINIFFPQVVGLSGGVANQGENLLVPLRKEVASMVFGHEFATKQTEIVCCTLGYRAGVIGAALLARA
ncbi:MAG: ROK family protein [Gemmiger sp.]|nr:ROK family protein [Gemmiger sp.]